MRYSPHGAVASAAISPDGKLVATGSWDHSAKIWDVATGHAIRKLDGGHAGYINSVEFSPDGSELLTASDDGTARFGTSTSGKLDGRPFHGPHGARAVRHVFAGWHAGAHRRAAIRRREFGIAPPASRCSAAQGPRMGRALCGQFSADADGKRIITGSQDDTAKIWDAATGQELITLEGHTAAVTVASPSRPMARACSPAARTTRPSCGTPKTGKEILSLPGHTQEVTSVSFSPDGRNVLTSSRDGTAIIWLASDWRKNDRPKLPGVTTATVATARSALLYRVLRRVIDPSSVVCQSSAASRTNCNGLRTTDHSAALLASCNFFRDCANPQGPRNRLPIQDGGVVAFQWRLQLLCCSQEIASFSRNSPTRLCKGLRSMSNHLAVRQRMKVGGSPSAPRWPVLARLPDVSADATAPGHANQEIVGRPTTGSTRRKQGIPNSNPRLDRACTEAIRNPQSADSRRPHVFERGRPGRPPNDSQRESPFSRARIRLRFPASGLTIPCSGHSFSDDGRPVYGRRNLAPNDEPSSVAARPAAWRPPTTAATRGRTGRKRSSIVRLPPRRLPPGPWNSRPNRVLALAEPTAMIFPARQPAVACRPEPVLRRTPAPLFDLRGGRCRKCKLPNPEPAAAGDEPARGRRSKTASR